MGGGPAGLAAAEIAAASGARVLIVDQMPSVGRKLLMAGKSGLNLTKDAEPDAFGAAYRGSHAPAARAALADFGPAALREWADGLGVETFVGSSGLVFPQKMKASPLLRAWVGRLARQGVAIRTRRRLVGLDYETRSERWRLELETSGGPAGPEVETGAPSEPVVAARALMLALGGASWPRLGSDGRWRGWVGALGVQSAPFEASNVGWRCAWSEVFRTRFAGQPLKNIAVNVDGLRRRGELTVTETGLEGGPLYALGPEIAAAQGRCTLDLTPDRGREQLEAALSRPPGKTTVTSWLRKRIGLDPVKIGLLREAGSIAPTPALAARIKAAPLDLSGRQPIEEAISSSGGVLAAALDDDFMSVSAPGLFCVGEMTDWDAPTGGYLLNGCLAMGRAAGAAAARWAGV